MVVDFGDFQAALPELGILRFFITFFVFAPQFNLLIKFTTKAAIIFFSFGWLSAIMSVMATFNSIQSRQYVPKWNILNFYLTPYL